MSLAVPVTVFDHVIGRIMTPSLQYVLDLISRAYEIYCVHNKRELEVANQMPLRWEDYPG